MSVEVNPMPDIKAILSYYQIQAPSLRVNELVLDSREVGVHSVFVAIPGHALDGRDFIPQAISLGAKMVLVHTDNMQQHGLIEMREQTVLVSFFKLAASLSELAARFYGFPAEKLDVIAVTGTNGKTSTVQLISQLRSLLGDGAASIGTLGAGMFNSDVSKLQKTLNTTPDACQIQRLMAGFVTSQAQQVAFEASSHALVQGRIEGLKTDVAVFTNLTRDHLDYHGSMQAYATAKRRLLSQPKLQQLVLNLDDQESQNWMAHAHAEQKVTVFSTKLSQQDVPAGAQYCLANDIHFDDQGVTFTLDSSWGQATIKSGLLGQFNVANLLAALSALLVLGKPLSTLAPLCAQLRPVAGRMELFEKAQHGNMIVDYAHTPDALEQALVSARVHCAGNLICVFGCGGDRDQGKRAVMGEIANRLSNKVYLTTDNSRTEAPSAIVADIISGIDDTQKIQVELDRKKAIQLAMANSVPGDLILIAGKGHETTQTIGNHCLPYDEREYVRTISVEDKQ
ncbi:UDP-N-acetylmuramoyl-L-alanyl-D-glutamate--2,6-diaminopimelate ligase [Aliiglaciecola litoralis]|uniref:UDP-N-acetylmuramyl-tripeptide synthetase n=1 Tax=Aliiglaciecola litoralis TaxID=582857 RepID=A0ABP3WQZ6_9ALTE